MKFKVKVGSEFQFELEVLDSKQKPAKEKRSSIVQAVTYIVWRSAVLALIVLAGAAIYGAVTGDFHSLGVVADFLKELLLALVARVKG